MSGGAAAAVTDWSDFLHVTDSPLAKVLRLAAVAPYRRVENNKPEQVRGYQNARPSMSPGGYGQAAPRPAAPARPAAAPSAPMHPGGYGQAAPRPAAPARSAPGTAEPEQRPAGWIPRPDWLEGQRNWIKEGEAAWKGRGAAARQRAAAKDAEADAAAKGREAAAGAGEMARTPRQQGIPAKTGGAMSRAFQAVQAEGQQVRQRLDSNPLFGGQDTAGTASAGGSAASDATTSIHALYGAAVSSAVFSGSDLQEIRAEIASIRADLSTTHGLAQSATETLAQKAEASKAEKARPTEGRALLAVDLTFLVGTLIFGALTGGLGFIATLIAAVHMLPDATKSFAAYLIGEKETGLQRLFAHPVKHAHAAVKVIRGPQKTKDVAAQNLQKFKNEFLGQTATIGSEMVLLLAAQQPPAGPPAQPGGGHPATAQTARILRLALTANGLDHKYAVPIADEIARRVEVAALKRMTARGSQQ